MGRSMARLARVAPPGDCYHVTHRGNRRARIFLEPGDREAYCGWLKRYTDRHGLRIWAWRLMTNHVVEPEAEGSLSLALGHGHGKYAQWFNRRYGLTGHLWEGRFFSTALDEEHLWAAVRYVELKPARARLVERGEEWEWSSARAHVSGEKDQLLSPGGPLTNAELGLEPVAGRRGGTGGRGASAACDPERAPVRRCRVYPHVRGKAESSSASAEKPSPKPERQIELTEDLFS